MDRQRSAEEPANRSPGPVVLAWLPVTLPLLWEAGQTVKMAAVLFRWSRAGPARSGAPRAQGAQTIAPLHLASLFHVSVALR
jgi:hypothetical protein